MNDDGETLTLIGNPSNKLWVKVRGGFRLMPRGELVARHEAHKQADAEKRRKRKAAKASRQRNRA